MPLIEWDPSLATGQLEIDAQHTVLIAILNRLHDAITTGEAEAATGYILHELIEYTRYHFSSEEALMEALPVEYVNAHKAKHAQLIEQVQGFQAQQERGEISPDALLEFLKDWLIQHITRTDKQLAAKLAEL